MKTNHSYIVLLNKVASTKQGKPYSVLTIQDDEEKLTINVWGADSRTAKLGDLIQFSKVKESDGFLSTSVSDIQVFACPPDNPLCKFLPQTVSKEDWFSLCDECCKICSHPEIIRKVFALLYSPYSTHTAARSNHHAWNGGLLQHTYEIVHMFIALYPSLPFRVEPFLVVIGGLFHDYGKLQEYTDAFEATPAMSLIGHPSAGAEALGAFLRKEGLDSWTVMNAQHIVLSHHGRLEYGSPVLPSTTEAFLVAKLDELSGHGVMYDQTPSGNRSMDTTIYHYNENIN